jgi:NTP pyrophosphatase (non-canonical NTP hydrolase)
VTFTDYEEQATFFDLNPAKEKGNIVYHGLALAGEAGELANEVKKFIRDDKMELTEERRQKMILEAGDVLWYLQGFARQIGTNLDEIAFANINKLSKRRAAK